MIYQIFVGRRLLRHLDTYWHIARMHIQIVIMLFTIHENIEHYEINLLNINNTLIPIGYNKRYLRIILIIILLCLLHTIFISF